MHSSKPRWRCGPRGLSPGFGTGISAIRNVTREPISPETGSSELRPGSPRRFASDCFNSRAIASPPSFHLPQALDLGGAALHGVELRKDFGRFPGDRVDDVGQHAPALLGAGVLR